MVYENGHIENVNVAEWRKAVREARMRIEAERNHLQERLDALGKEYAQVLEEGQLLDQVVHAYEARLKAPPKGSPLAGKSLREILIIHFALPDGTVVGRDASISLLAMGYFSNRRSADGAVYTTLAKPPFLKIKRGVYRIPPGSPEWIRLRDRNGHRPLPRLSPSQQVEFDVVQAVALDQQGYIRFAETKRVLARSGLFKNGSNVNFAVRRVLTHSRRFQRVKRGLYRLVESTASLN